MKHPDRIAAALLLLFAAFTMQQALALPYWHEFAPGPGFVPFWLGVLLAAMAAALLVRSFRVPAPWRPDRPGLRRLAVILTLATLTALASTVVGLIVASGAFLAAVLFYLNPGRPGTNVAVAAGAPLVLWLIFVRWLMVPLPRGPWGF